MRFRALSPVLRIGPWNAPRPPAPDRGDARINILTPEGLFFGQGSLEVPSQDPLGANAMSAATQLMQRLIAKTSK